MKTIEEKAMEFTKNRKNVVGLPVNDLWIFEEGFVEGYIEATRWRDPEEEPPINQDIVLVKTDNDCYATAYFHGKASGFICYGDDAYIEFGDIIGWRPIE